MEDRGQVPDAIEAALREAGLSITREQILRVRGASKRRAIRQLLPPYQESRAESIYQSFKQKLKARYQSDGVRSIAGAEQVIDQLREDGIKVALNTGFDRDITSLLLAALPLAADAVVCGDDVANGRPAPDMILLAMKQTGVSDPSHVANVGDTTLDLEAGARLGVRWNVGVLSGAHGREALERAPHTHIIQSIADLSELFRRG